MYMFKLNLLNSANLAHLPTNACFCVFVSGVDQDGLAFPCGLIGTDTVRFLTFLIAKRGL